MTRHYGEIWHWTFRQCLGEQNEAYVAAIDAAHWRDTNHPILASLQQRKAAYHHEQMRIRLERLIGVN